MNNVLFVCSGDTCRSAMASAIMKHKLKEKNVSSIRVSSAGLFVTTETNMHENAKKALKTLGVKVPRHKATQLTEKILKSYRYVLTMTMDQCQTILNRFPYMKNVYSLSQFVGSENIADPYGKSEAVYYNVARYLEEIVERVINKLTQGEA